jgi:hypothetical protein
METADRSTVGMSRSGITGMVSAFAVALCPSSSASPEPDLWDDSAFIWSQLDAESANVSRCSPGKEDSGKDEERGSVDCRPERKDDVFCPSETAWPLEDGTALSPSPFSDFVTWFSDKLENALIGELASSSAADKRDAER